MKAPLCEGCGKKEGVAFYTLKNDEGVHEGEELWICEDCYEGVTQCPCGCGNNPKECVYSRNDYTPYEPREGDKVFLQGKESEVVVIDGVRFIKFDGWLYECRDHISEPIRRIPIPPKLG